ncbi:MAG TPA: zinc ribbon domain-containing protein [Patescibacteria group bacterium]
MDGIVVCPKCGQFIKTDDYFCSKCGQNIRPRPLSTSLSAQILLYLKTILLPPLGLVWGLRYLRQPDNASKIIGLIAVVITVIEVIWMVQFTVAAVGTLNNQINQQVNLYGL